MVSSTFSLHEPLLHGGAWKGWGSATPRLIVCQSEADWRHCEHRLLVDDLGWCLCSDVCVTTPPPLRVTLSTGQTDCWMWTRSCFWAGKLLCMFADFCKKRFNLFSLPPAWFVSMYINWCRTGCEVNVGTQVFFSNPSEGATSCSTETRSPGSSNRLQTVASVFFRFYDLLPL